MQKAANTMLHHRRHPDLHLSHNQGFAARSLNVSFSTKLGHHLVNVAGSLRRSHRSAVADARRKQAGLTHVSQQLQRSCSLSPPRARRQGQIKAQQVWTISDTMGGRAWKHEVAPESLKCFAQECLMTGLNCISLSSRTIWTWLAVTARLPCWCHSCCE